MPSLSATIITLNEAENIQECISSLTCADEVLVVDSGSTDGTPDLARASGARVIERDWPGYPEQKDFAASQATHDWILSIDADERVTPELAAEVRSALAEAADRVGFRIPRLTNHMGRWLRTTDWYPDHQLRLYDRRQASWASTPQRLVHESVTARGRVGELTQDLLHLPYRNLEDHYVTLQRYSTLAATQMARNGRRIGAFALMFHPPAAFLRNYLLKLGFLDGLAGLTVSAMNAHYVAAKFSKLWMIQGERRR